MTTSHPTSTLYDVDSKKCLTTRLIEEMGLKDKDFAFSDNNHTIIDRTTVILLILLFLAFTNTFVNSLLGTPLYSNFNLWCILFGYFLYTFLFALSIIITLFIHKLLKDTLLHIIMFLSSVSYISLAVMICYYTKRIFHLFQMSVYLLFFTVMYISAKNDKLERLLFNISAGKFANVRQEIVIRLIGDVMLLSTVIYCGFSTITLNILNLTIYGLKPFSVYLLLCLIFSGIVVFLNLLFIPYFASSKTTLMGILMFINRTKRKQKMLNNEDVIKSQKQLNNMNIRKDYYSEPSNTFKLRYGNVPKMLEKEREFYITKRLILEYEKQGFPLRLFKSTGSFVYSLLYDVDVQKATNMFVSASYHSGYLRLLNGEKLSWVTGYIAIGTSLGVTLLTAVLSLPCIMSVESSRTEAWILLGCLLGLMFISTAAVCFFVNGLTYGYSLALVCLVVEDPEQAFGEKRYRRRLNEYMKEICEVNKISQ
eukprot:GAHX01001818.1.p1 GENE.GAHX01001818.1~~GAHX01001818.1.p1  ORF type:complete len:480 (+),score=36.20 GAHX01001818.1:207-1646(+)